MKKYCCVVSYDGSCFHGWQIQPHATTVQQTIQEVLSQIHKRPMTIVGAGRTDANVHAMGQTFHFESELGLAVNVYQKAMNSLLPDSIRILSVREVDVSFHARFDVSLKHYQYRINLGEYDLFQRKYCYQLNKPLNIDDMQQASQYFIGEHDFTSFNATPLADCPNQVRRIQSIDLHMEGSLLLIDLVGNGFLRYMVRMLVKTLIEVGLGHIPPQEVLSLLLACDKQAHSYLAPACGLWLMNVIY